MSEQILIVADRLFECRTSAHIVAREIKRQRGKYTFLSVNDLLSKKDTLSFQYDKGRCRIIFKKRGKSIDLKREVRSVFHWRPMRLDDFPGKEKLKKDEYKFFSGEWRNLLKGVYFSLTDRFWLNPYPINMEMQEKAYQLQMAQQIGFTIPFTFISTSLKESKKVFGDCQTNIIYKPFLPPEITAKDKKGKPKPLMLYTTVIKKDDFVNFETDYATPNIFQEYVPKKKEVRITVIGRAVFAAECDSQKGELSKHDWRKDIYRLPFNSHQLPPKISDQCFRLMRKLGLNYCTIDMI